MEQQQLNRIELRGTVGSVRKTKVGDKTIVAMTVATNFAYRDKEGCAVIETTWHSVRLWESDRIPGEILDGLGRADKVHIIGRVRNIRVTDRDGNDRTTCEVVATSIEKIAPDEALTFEM